MKIKAYIQKLRHVFRNKFTSEQQQLMIGRLLSESVTSKKNVTTLNEVEFKIFSQWGDDGIIQWLINNLEIPNKTFVEFGVGNYRECGWNSLDMY